MLSQSATLTVIADRLDPRRGMARVSGSDKRFTCALGKGGVSGAKREGDGATPLGRFPLRQAFYRPDRAPPPVTALPVRALTPEDGWCDDPAAADYNGLVRLPFAPSHERLWREDRVYDLIVVIGYNDSPVVRGDGSAIFIHLARDDYAPTEGCIAFAREDLLEILQALGPEAQVEIVSPPR